MALEFAISAIDITPAHEAIIRPIASCIQQIEDAYDICSEAYKQYSDIDFFDEFITPSRGVFSLDPFAAVSTFETKVAVDIQYGNRREFANKVIAKDMPIAYLWMTYDNDSHGSLRSWSEQSTTVVSDTIAVRKLVCVLPNRLRYSRTDYIYSPKKAQNIRICLTEICQQAVPVVIIPSSMLVPPPPPLPSIGHEVDTGTHVLAERFTELARCQDAKLRGFGSIGLHLIAALKLVGEVIDTLNPQ